MKVTKRICFLLIILIFSFGISFSFAHVEYNISWQRDFQHKILPVGIDSADDLLFQSYIDLDHFRSIWFSDTGDILFQTELLLDGYDKYWSDFFGNSYALIWEETRYIIRKYSKNFALLTSIPINRTVIDLPLQDLHVSEKGSIFGVFYNSTIQESETIFKCSLKKYDLTGEITWSSNFSFTNKNFYYYEMQLTEGDQHIYFNIGNYLFKLDKLTGVTDWLREFSVNLHKILAIQSEIFITYCDNSLAYSPTIVTLIDRYNNVQWNLTWDNSYGFSEIYHINYNGKYIGINRVLSGVIDLKQVKHAEFIIVDKEGNLFYNYTIENVSPEDEINPIFCFVTSENSFYEIGFYFDDHDSLIAFLRFIELIESTSRISQEVYVNIIVLVLIISLNFRRKRSF